MGLPSAYYKQMSGEKWERKKSRMVHTLWKETERKAVSSRQITYLPPGTVVKAMRSRPRGRSACHSGPQLCLGWATAKGHLWVPDSTAARGLC